MSDGIKRFPPEFDSTKKYPRQYDLENIDVYVEAPPGEYFHINGIPDNIGFGKHAFTIYIADPAGLAPLKNFSNVLFEAKDSVGNLIFSGTTTGQDLSGASVCYIWIKEDPLRTTKNIQEGIGSLTIVGQLDDVPIQYNNVYNVRTTFPLNIRTEYLNTSPILFQSSSKISSDLFITETLEADIDNPNFNKSYANITLKNLETFGGEVETIQISYLESGSLSVLEDAEFTFLTQQTINKVSGSYEDDIDFRLSRGMNPISQSLRVVMPPMANQSGSNFGLGDNKFKFKFEFLNKNNEKAKDFNSGEELNLTSSFIDFVGPATVITGENNLIAGQMYIGNSVGQGIEVSAENSAFLRSIGYLGFTSASAGSGSGFMLYSGSVLGANTDDYSQGGVGFEFVSSSEAFMRFNTNPGLFDVRAKSFFVGSENTQFISGSGESIEISSSKFHLRADGSLTMSGKLAVEAGGTIGGFTIGETALSTAAFIISSSQDETDPASFISSSNFKVSAGGQLTASAAYIDGAIITGSTNIDVANDILIRGQKIASINVNNNINLGDENAIITASAAIINTLTFSDISGSSISASGIRVEGDVVLDGTLTANNFVTNTISENFSEGGTLFGNTNDDIHAFTGSLKIQHTGSNNVGLLLSGSNLEVIGNIAASSNISSSATLISNEIDVRGHITASGNISASGNLYASKYYLHPTKETYIGSADVGDDVVLEATDDIRIRPTDDVLIYGNDDTIYTHFDGVNKRVGIGTSTPTKTLEVAGDISASGKYYPGTDGQFQVEGDISASGNISSDGTGSFEHLIVNADSGVPSNHKIVQIQKAGSNLVTIDEDGDTIIGGVVVVQGDYVYNDGNQNFGVYGANDLVLGMDWNNSADAHAIHFTQNEFDNTPANTLMIISSSGNVGIGTITPDSDLQIYKASGTTQLKITSNTDNAYLYIDSNQDGNSGEESGIIFADNGSAKWEVFKTSGNDYSIHDYTRGASSFLIADGGDMKLMHNGGDVQLGGSLVSPSFESGFAGSGFKIDSGSDGKHSLTIDDLTVRGQMSVYEMLIHQVRATNGSLFIANTGRIISASLENASLKSYRLFFDTGSGYGHSFRVGDLIRAQRFTPSANGSGSTDGPTSYKSDLTIESVTGISESIARLTGSNGTTDAPQLGYEYVRIGNLSDSDRQGSIYLTADDENAPFIDVADGIQTHAGFNTTGTIKTRMGKLSGITSTKFGTLTGYGFYASGSAFLEGSINATNGSIGGWGLSNSIISSSNITLDAVNESISIESTGFGDAGIQLEYDSVGKFYVGDGANKFVQFDGTDITMDAGNFSLDTSGDMTATNVDLTGKITSTEGQIGGFGISSTALSSSNFTLSASTAANELFISHSNFKVKNSGQITASALILTGSADTNFLQFANGVLTIRGDVAASSLSTTNFNVNSAGQITASAGTIGGFTISSTSLTSGSKIVLDASQSLFSINDRTFGNNGVQLDFNGGSPRAFIGNKTGSQFSFDGTDLFISSSKFFIGGDEQFISGSGGKLQIRAQDVVMSGSSVRVETDDFFFGAQTNFISGANNQIEISSSQFHLDRDGNASFGGDIQIGSQATQTDLNDGLIVHYNFDQYGLRTRPGTRFKLINNVEHLSNLSASFSANSDGLQLGSGSNASANASLFFSGSDRTSTLSMTETDTVITTEDKYSVSFFIKPLNVARPGGPQMLYNWGGVSNGLTAFITSSKVITNFYETDDGSVTSASIDDDTMYHIVTTYNGGEAKIYLNSQLIQTSTTGNVGSITGFSGNLHIGGGDKEGEFYLSSGSAPIRFDDSENLGICAYEGFFDEFRVYKDKVLTPNEVTAIYLNPQANTSNVVHGGQITAGIIQSLNASDVKGTILNLQEGELHVGGSGSNARFLFDGTQLRVSASAFLVGSDSFISGSGDKIEISSSGFHLKPEGDAIFSGSITANAGTIGGFTLGTTKLTTTGFEIGNEDVAFALSSSKFQVTHDGQLTGSKVLLDGGKIGGFTISDNELSIDNIKLSSVEKGLVISSSQGVGKVLISSGSLSGTAGSSTNHLINSSFENSNTNIIISSSNHLHWFFKNDSSANADVEELWNSGSVSMSIATGAPGDGSKHLRINVHRQLGPAGTGPSQNPQ